MGRRLFDLRYRLRPTELRMTRQLLVAFVFVATTANAFAQLVDHTKIPVPLNGNIAAELASVDRLSYRDAGPVHEDKSYLVKFACSDEREFVILFPHPNSWTPAAKRESKQPIIAILYAGKTQIQTEVEPASKLNQLIVRLIKNDISKGRYDDKTLSNIKYTVKCLKDRKRHEYFDSGFAD